MIPFTESQNATHINATTTLFTGSGGLAGIFVSAASATPTITISDGAGTMVGVFTPVAATFYRLPGKFATSLIVTISGTVDCTVFWVS